MLDDDTPTSKAVAGGVQAQKRKAMQTSYPPETTRLRMACDRCHAHKLRCLRSESTEPGSRCERCRRAAVQCVYSPPNRLGRPVRSHSGAGIAAKSTTGTTASTPSKESQSSSHNASAWPSPKSPHPPSPMPYQDISTRGSGMDILADESGAFEDLHLSGSQFKLDMMPPLISNAKQPYEDANVIRNNGQGFPMENIPHPRHIPFLDRPNAHIPQEFTLVDENTADCVRKLTDLGLAQYNQLRQLKRMRSCTNRDKQGLLTLLHNYPIQEIMETARQLTELVDQFIQVPVIGGDLLSSSPDSAGEPVPDLQSPFFGDPLEITDFSDFLSQPFIYVSATPKSTSSNSSNSQLSSSISAGSGIQMDTSIKLHTTSCYLRLARLFVLFFTDLHDFLLFPNLADPMLDDKSRLFPGLKLGSFQPYIGIELEISIVVQVSEHILNRLCNSLGLPQRQDTGQSRLRSEMITPAMLQVVQVQERLDAQDEKGDTFTQLPLVINSVKKMIKVRPFL
ncbi:Zn(2)-C6 fungal-type domain-containing protein [Trichophyton interdigitale]|uniref:Zn(2)-C6 fungal-type domain-containing protein n=1 Tax=Trichophyton interdigitale TaxID=101480 RepID=A0A9P4YI12_9EURO|nr:Zn(2)-C6 fungal-type domain-containing protein [Trichophyton interdigitale]KAF3895540.1 Zn(2)-C6 fungal-type domain-containing protein [Trichophyton interdigitale]KAG8212498.1 Zn(2)-C6 fungal-type domain-containing protein [Trichophyton interdigitale]